MGLRWRDIATAPLERDEQRLYFRWLQYVTINGEPLRAHVYAIPNGGHRDPRTAAMLQAEGVTAGVLDINVDVASAGFHGLRIEMKRRGNKPTEAQLEHIGLRRHMGYQALVCYGYDEARSVTVEYLKHDWRVCDRWSGS